MLYKTLWENFEQRRYNVNGAKLVELTIDNDKIGKVKWWENLASVSSSSSSSSFALVNFSAKS